LLHFTFVLLPLFFFAKKNNTNNFFERLSLLKLYHPYADYLVLFSKKLQLHAGRAIGTLVVYYWHTTTAGGNSHVQEDIPANLRREEFAVRSLQFAAGGMMQGEGLADSGTSKSGSYLHPPGRVL